MNKGALSIRFSWCIQQCSCIYRVFPLNKFVFSIVYGVLYTFFVLRLQRSEKLSATSSTISETKRYVFNDQRNQALRLQRSEKPSSTSSTNCFVSCKIMISPNFVMSSRSIMLPLHIAKVFEKVVIQEPRLWRSSFLDSKASTNPLRSHVGKVGHL